MSHPLRLPTVDEKAVDEVCQETHTSFDQVVSLCVRQALPAVRAALSGGAGRVTNVDPLPVAVAERLYAQPDDDEEGIRTFMAAQAKTAEE